VNEKTLDTNALLKTIGGGLAVVLLVAGCGYGVNALVLGTAPGEIPANMETVPTGYWVYSVCSSCLGYLLIALIGAGYGFFAQRNGMAPHAGRMALGGALALLAVGVVMTIIGGIITWTPMVGVLNEAFTMSGLPPYGPFRGFLPLLLLISVCGVLAIYAALGAIGGAIYGLIARGRAKRASTAGPPTVE
jgi:hypothetical protein